MSSISRQPCALQCNLFSFIWRRILNHFLIIIIMIIKGISIAPICHTRWECRALHNVSTNIHTVYGGLLTANKLFWGLVKKKSYWCKLLTCLHDNCKISLISLMWKDLREEEEEPHAHTHARTHTRTHTSHPTVCGVRAIVSSCKAPSKWQPLCTFKIKKASLSAVWSGNSSAQLLRVSAFWIFLFFCTL